MFTIYDAPGVRFSLPPKQNHEISQPDPTEKQIKYVLVHRTSFHNTLSIGIKINGIKVKLGVH
ncbi:Protein CBG25305 [Caenorhabditis briggsae]|uniref:Protein CBG25305 n=1 Tax=Caenorhabditis briggsae TaxID=6238 RepID=B6IIH5_CAEBR|nr:Protein CBG25305 [Caenorhabditis briggsae]CAR99705.1 Protein CBG25305 [Caenorhabditis briggsae]